MAELDPGPNNSKYNSRLRHRLSHSTMSKCYSHNVGLKRKFFHLEHEITALLLKGAKKTHTPGSRTLAKPGVSRKLRKVNINPISGNGILRVNNRFPNVNVLPATYKSDKGNRTMQLSSSKKPSFSAPPSTIARLPRINAPCHMACTTALQTSSKLSDTTGNVEQGVVRRLHTSQPPSTKRNPTMSHNGGLRTSTRSTAA